MSPRGSARRRQTGRLVRRRLLPPPDGPGAARTRPRPSRQSRHAQLGLQHGVEHAEVVALVDPVGNGAVMPQVGYCHQATMFANAQSGPPLRGRAGRSRRNPNLVQVVECLVVDGLVRLGDGAGDIHEVHQAVPVAKRKEVRECRNA